MHSRTSARTRAGRLGLLGFMSVALLIASAPLSAQNMGGHKGQMQMQQQMMMEFMGMAPAVGYIKAHMTGIPSICWVARSM